MIGVGISVLGCIAYFGGKFSSFGIRRSIHKLFNENKVVWLDITYKIDHNRNDRYAIIAIDKHGNQLWYDIVSDRQDVIYRIYSSQLKDADDNINTGRDLIMLGAAIEVFKL